jgi:hypothetical protein
MDTVLSESPAQIDGPSVGGEQQRSLGESRQWDIKSNEFCLRR